MKAMLMVFDTRLKTKFRTSEKSLEGTYNER